MVTPSACVLLTGSRFILPQALGTRSGCRRRAAPAGHTPGPRRYPPPQALTGDVGAEDLGVLAARGVQCRGDRFPDVTGEGTLHLPGLGGLGGLWVRTNMGPEKG